VKKNDVEFGIIWVKLEINLDILLNVDLLHFAAFFIHVFCLLMETMSLSFQFW
jgi:hypothetical protein